MIISKDVFRLPNRNPPFTVGKILKAEVDSCCSDVVIDLTDGMVWVEVDEFADELTVGFYEPTAFAENFFESGKSLTECKGCQKWLGKSCGMTWKAVNSQGYCDTFIIAFDGMAPSLMLHALASSIEMLELRSVRE